MKWVVLAPHDFHNDVTEYLHGLGHIFLPTKPRENAERPDIVLFDLQAGKREYLAAGFWRGLGVPVIVMSRNHHEDRIALARRFGFWAVDDLDGLKRLIENDHPYLVHEPSRTREQVVDPKAVAYAGFAPRRRVAPNRDSLHPEGQRRTVS